MRLIDHLRTCVRANRLTNHRLQAAMAARIVMDRGATEQVGGAGHMLAHLGMQELGWTERDLFGA